MDTIPRHTRPVKFKYIAATPHPEVGLYALSESGEVWAYRRNRWEQMNGPVVEVVAAATEEPKAKAPKGSGSIYATRER